MSGAKLAERRTRNLADIAMLDPRDGRTPIAPVTVGVETYLVDDSGTPWWRSAYFGSEDDLRPWTYSSTRIYVHHGPFTAYRWSFGCRRCSIMAQVFETTSIYGQVIPPPVEYMITEHLYRHHDDGHVDDRVDDMFAYLGVSAHLRTGGAASMARMAERLHAENDAGDRTQVLVETCSVAGCVVDVGEVDIIEHERVCRAAARIAARDDHLS